MNDGYNEYYVAEMKVKMKRGEKENVLEGKTNGGVTPFGYRSEKQKYYVVESEAETVRYLFEMYAKTDLTVNDLVELAKKKGIVNRKGQYIRHASMSHLLRNRKYIGEYRWERTRTTASSPSWTKHSSNLNFYPHIHTRFIQGTRL